MRGPASVRLLLMELDSSLWAQNNLCTDGTSPRTRTSGEVFGDGMDWQGRGDDDRYISHGRGLACSRWDEWDHPTVSRDLPNLNSAVSTEARQRL